VFQTELFPPYIVWPLLPVWSLGPEAATSTTKDEEEDDDKEEMEVEESKTLALALPPRQRPKVNPNYMLAYIRSMYLLLVNYFQFI
jgi:hypothetical protein